MKIKTVPVSASTTTTPLMDQKIDDVCAGLPASYGNNLRLLSFKQKQNVSTLIRYIQTMKTETNLSNHYRKNTIEGLTRFCNFINKSFEDMTRDDIIAFLDLYRKNETVDPLHRWIGTYNQYRMYICRFFKWLYSPNVEYKKRTAPPIIQNIPFLKRREVSTYKPSDIWTPQDDLLFLKYCPSKRERCYHAMSRDLSCRPIEILRLKIKDIIFKSVGTSQYAEVVVNGKTGRRPIPLINSLPYLKDYLDHDHPMPSNPNAPLICGVSRGLGKHILPIRFAHIYMHFKKKVFPHLLDSPNVPPEDKKVIIDLLKKPWNPYIRRHSALTEKSKVLKEHTLRQHAGWSARSQMHLKYLHYFGNESSESLLEAYGLVDHGIQIDQLKPKNCTNCNEPNKPDSRFCAKCRMILSYDAWEETIGEQKKKDSEIQELRDDMNKIMEMIQENPKLARVKPEVLMKKKLGNG
jgi:integrase